MRIAVVATAAFGAAYLTSAIAIPPITRMAVSRSLLDYPDGERHAHTNPVPRLGGIAVFAGLLMY